MKVFLVGTVVGVGIVVAFFAGMDIGRRSIKADCDTFRAFTYGDEAWSCRPFRKEGAKGDVEYPSTSNTKVNTTWLRN